MNCLRPCFAGGLRAALVLVLLHFGPSQCPAAAADTPPASAQRFAVGYDDLEPLAPLPSWANAKTTYGAVGDGVADDSEALQKALDDLGLPGKASVLFIPKGIYRITTTLNLRGRFATGRDAHWGGVSIIGDHPATTKILWSGPPGEAMLVQDGGYGTRYSRLTWDGNKTAGYGIAHWWNTKRQTYYDGSSEDSDEVFQDMGIGITTGRMGSAYGQMNSEGQVRRVTFLRNWKAGINTGSWNALDWWVWDSRFIDCARGVSNLFSLHDKGPGPGAGAAYVYRSVFERSTVADINIANTQWFSMHNNVSLGSRRFFQAEGMGNNGAEVIIQNNRILHTTDPKSIVNGNLGPLILIDNQIRSLPGNGPVVQLTDWVPGGDLISIGNQYTRPFSAARAGDPPIAGAHKSDRIVSMADTVVKPDSIALTLPPPAPIPSRHERQVFEVPAGASARTIQLIIDEAVESKQPNAIVHLPAARYDIDRTLIVPARARIQITGDALTTRLWWTGPAGKPIFRLEGPSRATLRDMQLINFEGPAIDLPQADQPGGRIFVLSSAPGNIRARHLTHTQLDLQANTNLGRLTLDSVRNVVSIGAGGSGPLLTLKNESSALLADTWYEGPLTDLYRLQSGNVTFIGGVLAPATHELGRKDTKHPTILFDNYTGKAAFIGFRFNLNKLTSGVGIQFEGEHPDTHALFLGAYGNKQDYFRRGIAKGRVGLMSSKTVNESETSAPADNLGNTDTAFVLDMLKQARSLQWDTAPYIAPASATDVRIYRVKAGQTEGLVISGK